MTTQMPRGLPKIEGTAKPQHFFVTRKRACRLARCQEAVAGDFGCYACMGAGESLIDVSADCLFFSHLRTHALCLQLKYLLITWLRKTIVNVLVFVLLKLFYFYLPSPDKGCLLEWRAVFFWGAVSAYLHKNFCLAFAWYARKVESEFVNIKFWWKCKIENL